MTAFSQLSRRDRRFWAKHERQARTQLVNLRESRFRSSRTLPRYEAALRRFDRFCECENFNVSEYDCVAADRIAEQFVQTLWELGAPVSHASTFLSALKFRYPSFVGRGKIVRGWQAFDGWKAREGTKRAPPLPKRVLLLWVAILLDRGMCVEAAALLVCFHCYLRPAELLALKGCDITWDLERPVLRLINTKIGIRKGYDEFIEIEDPLVARVFFGFCRSTELDGFVFPLTYNHFRGLIRSLAVETGLVGFGYRPYSFRRGGASWDFRLHGSIDRAFHKGRWTSLNAAKLYLTEARANVGTHLFPVELHARYFAAKASLSGFVGVVGSSSLL